MQPERCTCQCNATDTYGTTHVLQGQILKAPRVPKCGIFWGQISPAPCMGRVRFNSSLLCNPSASERMGGVSPLAGYSCWLEYTLFGAYSGGHEYPKKKETSPCNLER